MLRQNRNDNGLKFTALLKSISFSFLFAMGMTAVVYLIQYFIAPEAAPWVYLTFGFLSGALVYLLLSWFGRREEITYLIKLARG